jgi:hypothetical protein
MAVGDQYVVLIQGSVVANFARGEHRERRFWISWRAGRRWRHCKLSLTYVSPDVQIAVEIVAHTYNMYGSCSRAVGDQSGSQL